jgi:MoaA/NifB/PqqE/SkfB family radical SAM enzyme
MNAQPLSSPPGEMDAGRRRSPACRAATVVPLPRALAGALLSAPALLRVRPSVSRFMVDYLRRFPVKDVGGARIVHSHLPPLDSEAYARFVRLHLVERIDGPSHAQIGITNACPQRCRYCYNTQRTGHRLDDDTIMTTIDRLKAMGVVWLGLTGGEPLLNRRIVRIVERAADGCAVKLFTTGFGLTPSLARDLKAAGLFSVCVSLDHWEAERHDANRRYPGAFALALEALETLRDVDGLHVGVSSVVSREMLERDEVPRLLEFLDGLRVHEAWLSEVKPSVEAYWDDEQVFTEDERLRLCAVQDEWNRARGRRGMTVNYLGHFEGGETFGCNAGGKMVYVDAFGEVSPCVFMPMTLGNVRDRPIEELVADMRRCMPPARHCWVNRNFRLLQTAAGGDHLVDRARTLHALAACPPAPRPRFDRLLYGGGRR